MVVRAQLDWSKCSRVPKITLSNAPNIRCAGADAVDFVKLCRGRRPGEPCSLYSQSMKPSFLTAEWRDLVMLNYQVEPSILAPRVPRGTELDEWDGQTFISLVAFSFLNTRVKRIPIPFHRYFEEIKPSLLCPPQKARGLASRCCFRPRSSPEASNRIAREVGLQRELRCMSDPLRSGAGRKRRPYSGVPVVP